MTLKIPPRHLESLQDFTRIDQPRVVCGSPTMRTSNGRLVPKPPIYNPVPVIKPVTHKVCIERKHAKLPRYVAIPPAEDARGHSAGADRQEPTQKQAEWNPISQAIPIGIIRAIATGASTISAMIASLDRSEYGQDFATPALWSTTVSGT